MTHVKCVNTTPRFTSMKVSQFVIISLISVLVACDCTPPEIHKPEETTPIFNNDKAHADDQQKNAINVTNETPSAIYRVSSDVFVSFATQVLATMENTIDKRCELFILKMHKCYGRRDTNSLKNLCEKYLIESELFHDAFFGEMANVFSLLGVNNEDGNINLNEIISWIPFHLYNERAFLSHLEFYYKPLLTDPPRPDEDHGDPYYVPLAMLTNEERYVFLMLHAYFKSELHTAFYQFIEQNFRLTGDMVECNNSTISISFNNEKKPSDSEIEHVFNVIFGYEKHKKREPSYAQGITEEQNSFIHEPKTMDDLDSKLDPFENWGNSF